MSRRPYLPWTPAELDELRQHYADTPTINIAERLGRSVTQVYGKAAALGLSKSAAFFGSSASGRLQAGTHTGASGRFPKGHVPANKGVKGWQAGGRGTETRFKPGHRGGKAAQLYQPIGTERVSKDGYLERKINDDMPLQRRWRAVHLLVWEAAHGPLPPGHAVAFKDRDKRNLALDNLELVSRAELMRRNTVHNLPKPLAELVQLRGALVRKINRITKEDPHAQQ